MVGLRSQLELNRGDKAREEEQLRALEQERGATLARTKVQARDTEDRLLRMKATEAQFANIIANLDADRRRADATRPNAVVNTSTIHSADYGHLDWPVSGPLVYTFGKAQTASNTTIRWNGVGIRAPVGTSVAAVAPGRVVNVGQLGTYGLTVIIDHGGGDYSIYGSLDRADVRAQQIVAKGQVIGEVGVSDPELPPHLHFEIRHGGADGRPSSVDPATWLRRTALISTPDGVHDQALLHLRPLSLLQCRRPLLRRLRERVARGLLRLRPRVRLRAETRAARFIVRGAGGRSTASRKSSTRKRRPAQKENGMRQIAPL